MVDPLQNEGTCLGGGLLFEPASYVFKKINREVHR